MGILGGIFSSFGNNNVSRLSGTDMKVTYGGKQLKTTIEEAQQYVERKDGVSLGDMVKQQGTEVNMPKNMNGFRVDTNSGAEEKQPVKLPKTKGQEIEVPTNKADIKQEPVVLNSIEDVRAALANGTIKDDSQYMIAGTGIKFEISGF